MPCLKSIGMDPAISISCKKGTTLQRNNMKMTIYDNFPITVKPVLSGPSQIGKTNILKADCSLMKVKGITECSLGAFCNTFDLH